ncbi:uroporphyrinogen-III C-methyltransferase, partial [Mesorhizobium sp. M2A.F.Ca.ET.042.01.1.1]
MSPINAKLNAFPVFMRIDGEAVAIVGNREEALAKARLLAQSSAALRIIADDADPDLLAFIAVSGAVHVDAAYEVAHLQDVALVFAASGDKALDRRVAEDARRLGIPVNAVDQPDVCDFFTPALVNRAPVAIAIGTEGAGPVLAQMLRVRIDRMLSPSLGRLAALAASFRAAAEKLPKGNRRRRFWSDFFAGAPAKAIEAGDHAQAHGAALELLSADAPARGHIALV